MLERNDWYNQIIQDKEDLQLKFSDDEVRQMTKSKFKGIVSIQMELYAKTYFENLKREHSK